MIEQIFEVKFEVTYKQEREIVKKLGLKFLDEYEDTDYYLKSVKNMALKIKFVKGKRIILSEVIFDGDCFYITCKGISEEEKDKLLETNPIETEISRRKRVYLLAGLNVRTEFDYMKQFPNRLFLEIYSDNKENVMKAKELAQDKLGLTDYKIKAYDVLLKEARNSLT